MPGFKAHFINVLNEYPEIVFTFSVAFPAQVIDGLKETGFEQNSQHPSDGVFKCPPTVYGPLNVLIVG
jgi:hypothetical protein